MENRSDFLDHMSDKQYKKGHSSTQINSQMPLYGKLITHIQDFCLPRNRCLHVPGAQLKKDLLIRCMIQSFKCGMILKSHQPITEFLDAADDPWPLRSKLANVMLLVFSLHGVEPVVAQFVLPFGKVYA